MNFTTASLIKASSKLNSLFLCFLAFTILASCNKPEDDFLNTTSGKNLLNLQQTDTISIDMVSYPVTRLWQTGNLTGDVIGTFNDPIFGRTTAGVYAQVRYGQYASPPTWTKTSTLDSLVLTVKLANSTVQLLANGTLGNSNFAGQTWHIFKQAYTMNALGAAYPSDTVLNVSMEIGNAPVRFNAVDSMVTVTIKGVNVNKLFRDSIFDTTQATFTDPTLFDQLFHGIYILPDSVLGSGAGNGELGTFDLTDTAHSKFWVYYDGGKPWNMVMNYPAQRANVYRHNNTNTIAWHNSGSNAPKNNDRVYLQSLAGYKCVVNLPHLANLVQNNMIVINQAEFIFPKVDSSADPFNNQYPPKILFRPQAHDGSDSVYDFSDDVVDYYAQAYQPSAKAYKYIMSRYIQRLLYNYRNNKNLKTFGINMTIPPDGPNVPSRTMLYTQHAGIKANRPKLVITYTKITDRK